MAVELCSENSSMSPRISFSHDLCHYDVVPVEQRPLRSKSSGLNSSIDFDFCVRESFDQESSSADELFSEGKILPTEIKSINNNKNNNKNKKQPLTPSNSNDETASPTTTSTTKNKKETTKPTNEEAVNAVEVDQKQSSTRSFWGFKRSSSLNCGSGYGRSLCPLPLLSRSNSTGSTPNNVKHAASLSHNKHKSSSSSSSATSYKSSTNHKPPLGKSSYKQVHQVNPVLNVPTANLFGLGSIFFNAKDKSHKKK